MERERERVVNIKGHGWREIGIERVEVYFNLVSGIKTENKVFHFRRHEGKESDKEMEKKRKEWHKD